MRYYEKRTKFLGLPIIIRKRAKKSRGFSVLISDPQSDFNAIHLWKFSIYWHRITPVRGVYKTW
jgi:hypothetical protein